MTDGIFQVRLAVPGQILCAEGICEIFLMMIKNKLYDGLLWRYLKALAKLHEILHHNLYFWPTTLVLYDMDRHFSLIKIQVC